MAIKPYLNMAGGMNFNTAPLFMKDSECEVIQNYNLDNLGSLTKRKGLAMLIGQMVNGQSVLNMYYFRNSQGSDVSNILAAINASGAATSVIKRIVGNAWADSQTGNTASAIPYFCSFIDYVFRTNGSDVMASTADLGTWGTTNCLATKKYKFCCVWQDRVYVLNDNSSTPYPSRIQFSDLPTGAPLAINWTASNYVDINPDDNDQITWGEPFGKVLLIFKIDGLYRWRFGQVEPDKIPGVQGTPQGLTVKQTQGVCFWANKYGVWALTNPDGLPTLISEKIRSFIENISDLSAMRAEVDRDHYKLSVGSVTVDNETYSNCVLVYTISKKAWHIETYPFTIKAMARMELFTIGSTALFADIYLGDSNGYIYRTNTGNTDYVGSTATPISGKILTKEHPLANFPNKTDLKKMWVLAKYGIGARVNYRLDRIRDKRYETFGDIKGRFTENRLAGKGRTIQLSITDNSIQSSQIEGFLIENAEVVKND